MPMLLAALVFLMILLIFAGFLVLQGGPEQGEIIRGRLEAIEKGTTFGKNALDLDLIRDELLSSIPAINKMLVRWLWATRLRSFISQAGLQVRAGKLLLVSIVLALAIVEAVQIVSGKWALAVMAGILSVFLPFTLVATKRARRLGAIERQFPEAIELLSRSVRAGHSFTAGLEIAATDLAEPAKSEFRITFDEQRFGLPVHDALMNLCERVPLMDVRLFVIALLVQKETGGNLAEILDNLAHVMRERFRISAEVRVRTAQGRFTAVILILLPLAMLLAMRIMDPSYVNVLFVDRWGQIMLIAAACLQVMGGLIVWRIVKIKV